MESFRGPETQVLKPPVEGLKPRSCDHYVRACVTLQNMHIFQGSQGTLEVSNKYINWSLYKIRQCQLAPLCSLQPLQRAVAVQLPSRPKIPHTSINVNNIKWELTLIWY
jgi:hypothetical protein